MTIRLTRRTCGLTLGLIATCGPWLHSAARLHGAEGNSRPEAASAIPVPAIIELEATVDLEGSSPPTERVQERYPNRELKSERYVMQDEAGNYVNHGPVVTWDDEGRIIGRGEFRNGARVGTWSRWFSIAETEEKFTPQIELGFEPPFTAQARFAGGCLHGTWTLIDAQKRQVSAWEFEDGRRHGMSAWWYPDGRKYRTIEYRLGELDGAVCEWSSDDKLIVDMKFVDGFRYGIKVDYHPSGEIKSECETLFAKQTFHAEDDFWNGMTAVRIGESVGRDQRHGKYTAWNLQGQKILQGQYIDDRPSGKFTWWYDDGNRAIEGHYVDGKQDGLWTWWHSNGLKQICGEYAMGEPAGYWRQWSSDGLVCETLEIPHAERQAVKVGLQPTIAPIPATTRGASSAPAEQLEPPAPPTHLRRVSFEVSAVASDADDFDDSKIKITPLEQAEEVVAAGTTKKLKPVVRPTND